MSLILNNRSLKRLVSELKTTQWLPPYNSSLIGEIEQEIKGLHEQIYKEFSTRTEDASTSLFYSGIARNKRGTLAYLNYRLKQLEKHKWLSGSSIPPHFYNQLHSDEIEYFRLYNALVQSYSSKVSPCINISADPDPPKDLYVSIRTKEDCGDIMLPESGLVPLHKDTTHLLKRTEAVPLIKQGKAEHVH